jgi:hypothetical protein
MSFFCPYAIQTGKEVGRSFDVSDARASFIVERISVAVDVSHLRPRSSHFRLGTNE